MSIQTYRPEIDGLRALAVCIVVLFHMDVTGFSNGFLGVDIFFVISGFLITTIILREHKEEKFLYGSFIVRRARRILPALFCVMLVCVPFAFWLMLPDALENFGQSIVASVFSANNILLWMSAGYWDLAAEYKPLLHTWSLGLEEQFYLLFPPLFLIVLSKYYHNVILILSFALIGSLQIMYLELARDPMSAFYLPHARAWQLLAGSLAAAYSFQYSPTANSKLTLVAIVLVVFAISPDEYLSVSKPIRMILATTGAALYVTWANASSSVVWIFIQSPVVFIGTISYSFYLWHQPILAFIRVSLFDKPTSLEMCLGATAAFLLAIVTWRFVEQPFRSDSKIPKALFLKYTGASAALLIALGLSMHLSNGFSSRLGVSDGAGSAGTTIAYNERVRSFRPSEVADSKLDLVVIVAGNSFARDFVNVILEGKPKEAVSLIYSEELSYCADDWSDEDRKLLAASDIVIFAGGYYRRNCLDLTNRELQKFDVSVKYVGPKHFGRNLNPLIRYSAESRGSKALNIPPSVITANNAQRERIGDNYIDLIEILSDDNKTISAADEFGVLLSTDNIHLSQAGASLIAVDVRKILPDIFDPLDSPRER